MEPQREIRLPHEAFAITVKEGAVGDPFQEVSLHTVDPAAWPRFPPLDSIPLQEQMTDGGDCRAVMMAEGCFAAGDDDLRGRIFDELPRQHEPRLVAEEGIRNVVVLVERDPRCQHAIRILEPRHPTTWLGDLTNP
jgi:hypothetical protein